MPSDWRVPVILFEDVPDHLQREPIGDRKPAWPEERCLARARGDTGTASVKAIPKEGGFQCTIRRMKDEGLCYRHWRAADEHIRFRAAEIVRAR